MRLTFYPAIDLRGGKAVRLYQGNYSQETVYSDDPVAMAKAFMAEGATWLHLVDLDGAKAGHIVHSKLIEQIANIAGLHVELGGGLRNNDQIAQALSWGVKRVIIGTAAVEQPTWLEELTKSYPKQIVVGLDAHGEYVATRGWETTSTITVANLLTRLNTLDLAAIIYTQIARDGAMQGPDLKALQQVLKQTQHPIVASGGVHNLKDLTALASLPHSGNLEGVIVGRALYEQAFTVKEALQTLAMELPRALR